MKMHASTLSADLTPRTDWTQEQITELFDLPFNALLFKAQAIHQENFDPRDVQVSTLLSIKTGGCAEDCKYCPQSAKYNTEVEAEKLMDTDAVIAAAKEAKEAGAGRFCMGAAWRETKARDLPKVIEMVEGVKALGMETCMTLGMLTPEQADALSDAGLDYYNHNLDTSEEYYKEVITTRTYQDRLDTLEEVRRAGMKTCTGGIVGMGENRDDRVKMLQTLATLPQHPQSVPINMLVAVKGTEFEFMPEMDIFDFVRTIAVARIVMPKSYVRLSAGRENMDDSGQALCFMAGANSIFYGEKLLTTANPQENKDKELLERLGMRFEPQKNAENSSNTTDSVSHCNKKTA